VLDLRHFLLSACHDVDRLLPPPKWDPAWGSDAARECANTEHGPAGPWGEDPVRTMYAAGALYLDTIMRCLRALGDALSPATTPYVLEAQARAAMEAGAVLWWLLEPGLGARRRVIRFWLIRASYHAGHAYAEIGKPDKALPQLRFYVQNADTSAGADEAEKVLESRFVIAQMLAAAGYPDEALSELQAIRPLLAEAFGADSTRVRNLDKQIDRLGSV